MSNHGFAHARALFTHVRRAATNNRFIDFFRRAHGQPILARHHNQIRHAHRESIHRAHIKRGAVTVRVNRLRQHAAIALRQRDYFRCHNLHLRARRVNGFARRIWWLYFRRCCVRHCCDWIHVSAHLRQVQRELHLNQTAMIRFLNDHSRSHFRFACA